MQKHIAALIVSALLAATSAHAKDPIKPTKASVGGVVLVSVVLVGLAAGAYAGIRNMVAQQALRQQPSDCTVISDDAVQCGGATAKRIRAAIEAARK